MDDAGVEEVGVQQYLLAGTKLDRVMEKASIVLTAEVFALNSRANKDDQLLLVRPGYLSILCSSCRAVSKTIIQVQHKR